MAAVPVLLAGYPPMTDFPHHEALVALLRTFGDVERWPEGMYVRNLGQPNQLFHLLAWPLSYVMTVTLACKLVTAAAVMAVPVATARLARHCGASTWVAAAMVPVALGWLFAWGFVANLLGLALLVGFLPALDRFIRAPTARGLAVAASGTVLLYLGHELMMFVYVAAAFLFTALWRLDRISRLFLRCAPGLLGIAMAFVQVIYQERLKTQTVRMVENVFWPLKTKLVGVAGTLVGVASPYSWIIFGSCVFVLGGMALEGRRARRGAAAPAAPNTDLPQGRLARLQAVVYPHRFVILAGMCLVLYLALPMSLNGASLVYQRFLAPAYALLAVAAGSSFPMSSSKLVRFLAGTLPLACLLVVWPTFVDSSMNHEALSSLLVQIPMKSSTAALDLDLDQAGRRFTVASGQSSVLTQRGGRVLYSFTDSTVAPVMLAPAFQWNEPAARVMFDNYAFRPAHDLTRFEYLLVHSSDVGRLRLAAHALLPDAVAIDGAGEWVLFRSTHDVVPIDSADVPLPTPRPATLGSRMRRMLAAPAPTDGVVTP